MIHLCTISRTERKSHAEAAVPTTHVHPSAQCVRVKRVRSWEYNACSIEHVQYEYKYGSSWQRSPDQTIGYSMHSSLSPLSIV